MTAPPEAASPAADKVTGVPAATEPGEADSEPITGACGARRRAQQLQRAISVQHAADHLAVERGDVVGPVEYRILDLGDRGVGVVGPSQRRHAGDEGRGHARAGVDRVAIAGHGAVDGDAGGGNVDGGGAVVAEARQVVVLVDGGHRDHVRPS